MCPSFKSLFVHLSEILKLKKSVVHPILWVLVVRLRPAASGISSVVSRLRCPLRSLNLVQWQLWQNMFEHLKHCLIGALIDIQILKTLYSLFDFIHNRPTNPDTSCATVPPLAGFHSTKTLPRFTNE
jgi:hypothetical protein